MGLFSKKKPIVSENKLKNVKVYTENFQPNYKRDYNYMICGAAYKFCSVATGGEIMHWMLNGKDKGYARAAVHNGKDWDGSPALRVDLIDGIGVKYEVGFVMNYKEEQFKRLTNMVKSPDAILYIEMEKGSEPRFTSGWLHVAFEK